MRLTKVNDMTCVSTPLWLWLALSCLALDWTGPGLALQIVFRVALTVLHAGSTKLQRRRGKRPVGAPLSRVVWCGVVWHGVVNVSVSVWCGPAVRHKCTRIAVPACCEAQPSFVHCTCLCWPGHVCLTPVRLI